MTSWGSSIKGIRAALLPKPTDPRDIESETSPNDSPVPIGDIDIERTIRVGGMRTHKRRKATEWSPGI